MAKFIVVLEMETKGPPSLAPRRNLDDPHSTWELCFTSQNHWDESFLTSVRELGMFELDEEAAFAAQFLAQLCKLGNKV